MCIRRSVALRGWADCHRKAYELCERLSSRPIRVLPPLLRCESPTSMELWANPLSARRTCFKAVEVFGSIQGVQLKNRRAFWQSPVSRQTGKVVPSSGNCVVRRPSLVGRSFRCLHFGELPAVVQCKQSCLQYSNGAGERHSKRE